jgi:spermidine/putrescine ABC transporter ATP-binding subunit
MIAMFPKNQAPRSQHGSSVHVVNVSKSYGSQKSVDGASLELAAEEFVTLLGPSGSGKTTLLNMVAGFVEPDTGDILVGGKSILATPPYRRGFGMVFQSYAIFPHLTVEENIAFPLRMRGATKAEVNTAVAEVIQLVNLDGMAKRYGHQLSGGQQQRVAFARAVVFKPPVLLMDECLSALDKKLRQQLQYELRSLQRRLGVTVLFVTHDQEEALAMSDRIAVMDYGRVVQIGTGRELYETPNTGLVARFFGENNTMHGRVVSTSGNQASVEVDQTTFVVARNDLQVGARAQVCLRPDHIRIAEPNLPGVEAHVEDVAYLGETVRATVRLHGGTSLAARFSSQASTPRPGEAIRISWDPSQVRAFPETRP